MSPSFDWNRPDLNWNNFHSLANLLSLRNGGQAEPSSLSDTLLEEDYWDTDSDGDQDTPSIDTGVAHQISYSGHAKLKRRFLDSFAEFAANKQGETAVACSAMKEAEDHVIIWISRNGGFSDVDRRVFDKLGRSLDSLSRENANQSATILWEEIVSYHRYRIEHSYIPNLRASFKAYDTVHRRNDTHTLEKSPNSSDILSVLRTLLFRSDTNGTDILEIYKTLVIESHNLRRTRSLERQLYSSLSATSKSKRLWLDIGLLARLRVAFQTFKTIATTLPSFQNFTIVLVPSPLLSANRTGSPLTLNETFNILELELDLATTKAVVGQNWTIAKIKQEFAKRQKQTAKVHAEVQMLMYLNKNELSGSGMYPYFGCSKLSCFMCNRFLQSYGRYTTRGCHGRLFKPWTVPSMDSLLPGHADRIAKALRLVQTEVVEKLKASVTVLTQRERTSVIGGSSILDGWHEEPSQTQLQVERQRMRTQRNRVAEMFRRQTEVTMDSPENTSPSRDKSERGDECSICRNFTRRRCSVCTKDFFCSDRCQEQRSGPHLFTCSKRPLTSADYLWKSLSEDIIPEEEDVLEDFLFNNLLSRKDFSRLFGIYGGLFHEGISAEDMHEWRIGGNLVNKIKDVYYNIPEDCRGGYFPWFLENLHLLECPITKDEGQSHLVATFYDKARPYLDIEDRNKPAKDLEPEAKRASYYLLVEMLLRITPNPMEKNWYTFGFVTCRGQGEESMLVDLYLLLLTKSDGSFFYEFHNRQRGNVPPATFTQFWKAVEAGTLIQLMDSKGLKEFRSELPFLEAFLSAPPKGPRPSVWSLKQFLEIDEPTEHPPDPSVDFDYGFVNCRTYGTFEDTCMLMEIYKAVLMTANPLKLHQACVAGNLFQFASVYVRNMDERWRLLMKNFYPLEEVGQWELGQELTSEALPAANEGSVGVQSLSWRLWLCVLIGTLAVYWQIR